MSELVRVLMERDDIERQEALDIVEDMKEQVRNGADPEEVLAEEGLEPDYILDVM